MGSHGIVGSIAIFSLCAVSVALLLPPTLVLARRIGLMDLPGGRKTQSAPIPFVGGIVMVTVFVTAVIVAAIIEGRSDVLSEAIVVLSLGVFLALIGLTDDIRGLSILVRMITEALAGFTLWTTGYGVDLVGIGWLDGILTVLWVVGVTNAFNMIDNMDGLATGVAIASASGVFALTALNDQVLAAAMSAGLCGCGVGLIVYNYFPARVYMGDSGAYFLGFMLAYLGLKIRFPDVPRHVSFLIPVMVLSVAVFEAVFVFWSRLREGRSPFRAGLDHVSHRLVKSGWSPRSAVLAIHAVAVTWSLAAFGAAVSGAIWILLVATLCLVFYGAVGAKLSKVSVYETSR